jgi:PAS domain S-box-containing protein
MMRKFLSWPIRLHLLLLVILLALPSIILIAYWGIAARNEAIEDAKEERLKYVNAVAGEQQAVIAGIQPLLVTLALLPNVQSRNATAVNSLFSGLLENNSQFINIGITDKLGDLWASATPFEGKVSAADRKYFRNAVKTGLFSSGEHTISRVVKKPTLDFAYPIKDTSNEISDVIIVALNLDYVQSLFEKISLPANSSFSLLDHQGIILYRDSRDPFSEQLVGKRDTREELFTKMVEGPDEGTYEAMGNDGKVRLTAYKKLRLPHESQPYLYIRSSIPKASVVSAANATILRHMAALVSIFAVGIILAAFLGKRLIVEPITKLKEASRQLAAGPVTVNVAGQVKDGELGELAHAFDDMVQALLRKEKEQLAAEEGLRVAHAQAKWLARLPEENPNPVLRVSSDGHALYCNPASIKLDGWKCEEGLPVPSPIFPLVRKSIAEGREVMQDVDLGGRTYWVAVTSFPEEGYANVYGRDITDRKLAEEALREAKDGLEERVKEQTYELYEESLYARSLIEASLDPLVTISSDGKIMDVNHALEEATGVPREQLIGSDFSDYFTEPEKARAGYEEVFRQGFVRDYPLELKHRDGQVTLVMYNASVYRDNTGRIMGVFAAARDITKRKQAEAAQRRLASELAMAEERERKRIAGVLHDDIAQTLAAARMRLDMLQEIPSDQELRVKEAKAFLLQSLQETRSLMNDLGNPVLFELGLEAACLALAKQMMERHHVRISCDIQDAFEDLNPDVKTILYQVIKELLNNVVKHSRAHNAQLMIDMENGHLRAKVTDDGVGFDPRTLGAPNAEGGFGLYSIKERLSAVDGSLSIESTPGTGTAVTAILPKTLH